MIDPIGKAAEQRRMTENELRKSSLAILNGLCAKFADSQVLAKNGIECRVETEGGDVLLKIERGLPTDRDHRLLVVGFRNDGNLTGEWNGRGSPSNMSVDSVEAEKLIEGLPDVVVRHFDIKA